LKIIPLSEGSFTIDKTKLFVPFDESQHELTDRPTGSLLVEIQPFVIVTSKDVLLLDTGLGYDVDGRLQIHENMKAARIDPGSITKVLLSHLHKDHAGGISHPPAASNSTEGVLNFPNADYYVHKDELDFAWKKGFPSYLPDELEALNHSDRVRFLHDEKGTVDGYIDYQVTGAHSPFHQVFWIRDENEVIFFGGDDAPQLQQMKIRYKTKYDHDPDKAMNLRKEWWEKGNQEGWTFLFYHDVKSPTFRK
jgi:glyoxylase-like metal-dependent hydrolase (beta-lactamase superfamily II)